MVEAHGGKELTNDDTEKRPHDVDKEGRSSACGLIGIILSRLHACVALSTRNHLLRLCLVCILVLVHSFWRW